MGRQQTAQSSTMENEPASVLMAMGNSSPQCGQAMKMSSSRFMASEALPQTRRGVFENFRRPLFASSTPGASLKTFRFEKSYRFLEEESG